MSLPSLILVPGAWHQPEHFGPLLDELSDIDVHTVRLASSGRDPSALGDMHEDADAITTAAAAIDGPAVVVAHSYGGIPVTQALANANNLRHIVYLSAFLLDAGESLLSSLDGVLPPWCKIHEWQGVPHHVEAMTPDEVLFQDVDPASAKHAIAQLGYQSYSSFAQEVNQPREESIPSTEESIPSTYVICEADNALPPVVQEQFAQRATDVVRLNTSHSSFLSQPAELAQILRKALASA